MSSSPSPSLPSADETQWYLKSATGINVQSAWGTGGAPEYRGAGIRIAIIDDGFDYTHPDLSGAYQRSWDFDARDRDDDAYASAAGDNHGTAVAGVIAASANGQGMVGVAYGATITGFRIAYSDPGTDPYAEALSRGRGYSFVEAGTGATVSVPGLDVVNASAAFAGPFTDDFGLPVFAGSAAALLENARAGRGGLGITTVFAAGNSRAAGENVNYHNYQNSPYTIAVAATDLTGKILPVSTPGAALLVSAPGNDIYTTDRLGSAGYSPANYFAPTGTSFAAPLVSGIVALMLEANPGLGYRDVQEILAYSARQTDTANAATWATNGAANLNGGGLHFSQDYGFGLADATAAVRLAESWQSRAAYVDPTTLGVDTAQAAIPDAGAGYLTRTLTVAAAGALIIDKVLVELDIAHDRVSDLTVTLTHNSSGTHAILIAQPSTGTSAGALQFTTTANTFWGEQTSGDWTLTVTDRAGGQVGTLNSWRLQAIGDAATTNDTYIYTNEAKGSKVLVDMAGSDTLNLAAVTSDTHLDLTPGSTSSIGGQTLTLSSDTLIESAWLGDGQDQVTGNTAANTLHGGRGNDVLLGKAGADTLDGGADDDRLEGGTGADLLIGGTGRDTFVFRSAADSFAGATDQISDFTHLVDAIDLSGIDAIPGTANTPDPFVWIGGSPFDGRPGAIRFSNGLLSADTDGDRVVDLQIASAGDSIDLADLRAGLTLVVTADPAAFGVVAGSTQSFGGQIYALYAGLLGRAPDTLGLEFWADRFEHGATARDLGQLFLDSAEGQARAGALSSADFVNQLYGAALGRPADSGGLAYWTDRLEHGAARIDVALGFVFSAEHLGSLQGVFDAGLFVPDKQAADVARLYYTMLARAPDAGGLQFWTDHLDHGGSLSTLAQGFLSSAENVAKYGAMSNRDYVDALYVNAFGRHAEADGHAFWTAQLDAHTSRADLAVQLSDSLEAQTVHLGQIEQGWHLV
ncbi:DUF4214 domain-containing protein [Methylobacterium oxalidis]|uniref:DUF4214 domain-containing protein n=1 Tax=Methylobacterium oxalidis TaxID=944322 RepID=UPI003315C258